MDTVDGDVALAIAGDVNALERLIALHHKDLRQLPDGKIARRHRAVLAADDVLQVTYTEAFLRIGQFSPDGRGSFEGWLTRGAENNLKDAIRALEREKRRPRDRQIVHDSDADSYTTLLAGLSASGTTPTRHASREEAKAIIDAALDELPPDYAKVIRLYDLDGLPIDEVAKSLGRRRGAVHMLKARAHERLRELLGNPTRFFSHPA